MPAFLPTHFRRHALTVLEMMGVLFLTLLIATAGMAYLISVQEDAQDQGALLRLAAVQSVMAEWAAEQEGFVLPATVEGRQTSDVTLVSGPAADGSEVSADIVSDREFVLATVSEAGACVALADDMDGGWGVARIADGADCDAAVAAAEFSAVQAGTRSLSVEVGN